MAAGPVTQWQVTITGVGPYGNGDANDIETLAATAVSTLAGATGQAVTFAKLGVDVPRIATELLSGHEKQLAP